ncbi:MAG: hypothetical protein HQM06_18000 [Magnetococcales bacterium]|nr:hypothetical protein [Magnetococcales bacterium]
MIKSLSPVLLETIWAMGIGWFVGCWPSGGALCALFTKAHFLLTFHWIG